MKKRLAILLCLLLVSGCAKPEVVETPPAETIVEETKVETPPEPEPEPDPVYSPTTGLEIDPDTPVRPVVALMYDNHPNARWQAGLGEADLLYEYRVEGDFTRYMALFLDHDPKVVGPVRSARPCFVDVAMSFDAILARYGGSWQADADIRDYGIPDVNGMFLEGVTFYRNHNVGKVAPHNAYTSIEAIRSAASSYEESFKAYKDYGLKFYHEKAVCPIGTSAWEMEFLVAPHNWTSYKYNAARNRYERYKDDKPHVDENTDQILMADNVILQFADSEIITDEGHRGIHHVGKGTGFWYANGEMHPIRWEKEGRQTPTVYTLETGSPVLLNPGTTYVHVIDTGSTVNVVPKVETSEVSD